MNKRKFMKDDDEDAQDQDYQNDQDSDDDYEPSSANSDKTRQSIPSLRVTQSRSTPAASGHQSRDNEEAEGETSNGGSDATVEDKTSADQVPNGKPEASNKVDGARVRTCGKTKYCGVATRRIKQPVKAMRDKGDFFCIICGSSFTRAEGVNYHFLGCVERYGNPQANNWNDHPSCASRRSRNDALAANPNSRAQPSAPKKRRIKNLSSGPSSASDALAQAQPASRPDVLPTGPRTTRVRPTQGISETQPAPGPGVLPTGPRTTRSRPTREVSETQTISGPGALPTGPRATRARPTQKMSETQPASLPGALPTRSRATRSKPAQRASETEPDLGIFSTNASSTSTQGSSEPSTARPKATRAKPGKKQQTSNRNDNRKRKTPSKKASGIGKQKKDRKFHIDESLPPLSDLDAIFHDMVSNAWENLPMEQAMEYLSKKQIHLATMCSGTESPLLALGKIQNDLRLSGKPALNIKHLFSAEISPPKQAYIERNFHPNKLFRDIREIAEGGQATTAYGALTDVPADVDILVAGFSCVDFSNLNKHSKKLTDTGESGDTFRAILEYAKKYRPAIIILENVDGAPWDLIQAIWQNDRVEVDVGKDAPKQTFDTFWDDDDPAYSAIYQRVDSKNYYIPQTRTRRYMICLDRFRFASLESADAAVQDWKDYMVALERKASVSVEAFLLPEDDPHLQSAKDEMSKIGKPRRDTDWELCAGRHERYRTTEKLGTLRPILNWTNDGSAKASSYLWTDWTLSQVERVWDSIEISFIRNAAKGYDSFYKTRFWELSQNVDRFKDDTPAGVVMCLTPKGQPFSTTRGGPITGREAIALQGLPIDELLLTRESQKELADLAGNAMTSTVVGAALLSALAVGYKILTRAKKAASQPLHESDSILKEMRYSELEERQVLRFDGSGESSLEALCKMAKASVRLCHCEGQSLKASALIRMCKCCHHHCCEKCGDMPKHNYELLGGNGAPLRTEPQEFQARVRYAIPTRLEMDGFSSERLENFAQLLPERSEQDWRLFSEAILLAFKEEYRYESAKRSHCWTVTYNAVHSQLKLVFDQEEIYWLLYGKPGLFESGDSRVRKLLDLPLARLTVRGKNMRGDLMTAESILGGSWEVRLPIAQNFSITITPQGELTDSWEKKLGLEDEKFIDKQVYTSLHIARTSDPAAELILDHEICGDYDLLENCGTACSSLHKKRPTADGRDAPSLFLFLDVDRVGPPDQDCYVFSTEKQRLEYGEVRYVAAKVDSKWRPPYEGSHVQTDGNVPSQTECTVSSRWESCAIFLRPHEVLEEAYYRFPKGKVSIPVFGTNQHLSQSPADDIYGCLHGASTTALLSCEIPGQLADSAGWQVGRWTIIDRKSERQIAAAFAWLFARVKDLGDFGGNWRPLGPLPRGYQKCLACAPEPPKIMWTCSRSSKKAKDQNAKDQNARDQKIIPYEDGREAGDFERKMKARPAPFLVQTYIDDDEKHTGRLLVGLNLPTLVHRALSGLGHIAKNDDVKLVWRLDTRYEPPTRYKLKEFTLTSSELSREAKYDFPTGEKLRPEQKRSLKWMIGQEAEDVVFYEEETEEAVLSQLSWRVEVRVRRTRNIRGGILADEVGYGKTATTLALIDAQTKSAKEHVRHQTRGCIPVKATLILVPSHLVHQWKGQTHKFLGIDLDDEKILIIEDVAQLAKISVKRVKKAVIIISSWKVVSSPVYMIRMSHFAALPQGPSSGKRGTDAWLTRACDNIEKHMEELVSDYESPKDFAAALKLRLTAAHTDKDILRSVPTQRLKGAKYTSRNPAECVRPVEASPNKEDLEKFMKHLTNSGCTDLDSMTGILFHMFDFYRLVVDEYTYVDENQNAARLSSFINTINARSRWVLSGTPNIQDFENVRNIASFLAYNLGVVDDAAGVLKGATIQNIREDRTAAEQFRAFGYSHTAAWHISRQAHAQRFLDKYASKNVAEIGLIESMLHLHPHFLGAEETILNAELQQQLQSTEMRIVLHGKSKRDNDRLQRYRDLLKGCKTAAECLLKSCLFFGLEDTRSAENEVLGDAMDVDTEDESDGQSDAAMDVDTEDESDGQSDAATAMFGASEKLITIREQQMETLVVELEHNLLHAAWLEQQCGRATNKEHRGDHYRQWKSAIEGTGLRDPNATSDLRHYLSAAPEKVDANTEDIFYRDKPTAEELINEKKAADERKKQEKAKRTADRRGKAGKQNNKVSKRSKATAHSNEDCEEVVDSDGEPNEAEVEDPNPPDLKPIKVRKDDFANYAHLLRALTGHLRSLASELTSRTRSLRFAHGALELQQWYFDLGKPPSCGSCGRFARDHDNISINIRCGHFTCKECIQKTGLVVCTVAGCSEGSESHCLRNAVDLVGDGQTWRHGSRLGNIIGLINSLPKDEQVLLFVQFEEVMLNMASALEIAGISNYALSQKAGREMINMMNDFQDNKEESKKRVLLLNPSNETAAGINLTNANHIIFASPLLTSTQQAYNASSTQCIGRAKRYGQQKTVHIYRFLALRTIDVDLLQEREQKTLAKKKDPMDGGSTEEWLLVREDEIDDTLEAGWGSGYSFKSNPEEEDD